MVSVDRETSYPVAREADHEVRPVTGPVTGMELFTALRQQLDQADQLGFDLVAIRIAEALDVLAIELGLGSLASATAFRH